MIDDRALTFGESPESEPRYDAVRTIVLFAGRDGERTVPCAISLEALEDHFDADERNPIRAFRANRGRIEHEARRKYLAGQVEADGSVLVRTEDL